MAFVADLVAGARPNFIKLAPVARALRDTGRLETRIVHTGQHYDPGMSQVFFDQLRIPQPDVHLEVGSGSQGAQTARILERYEAHLLVNRPDVTVVFGDVNSTAACALAAVKLEIPLVHVEAGLRSFDRTMPEEINRVVTDAVADLLLVSEPSGMANLEREGVDVARVRLVGNVMVDTLVAELNEARALGLPRRLGVEPHGYGVVTMHRPSNVDDRECLARLLRLLVELAEDLPLVFPMHPRTRAAAERANILSALLACPRVKVVEPLSYRENLGLMADAVVVLTDSGGMQEETSVLGVPCMTLRDNTERPITVERGTSRLVGNDPVRIRRGFGDALSGNWPPPSGIPLWDGKAAGRVATAIEERYCTARGVGDA